MELYYGKSSGDKIFLEEEESNHLINVRRSSVGDTIQVTDGNGNLFSAKIEGTEKRSATLQIISKTESPKKSYHLHIAIAPTKSLERIEWFLEKATEFGIDEISFLLCRHSERKEIKIERLNRVLIAAMKQSLKTFLPKLNPINSFQSFIDQNHGDIKLICNMTANQNENLNNNYHRGKSLITLIGPEGDFHPDEIKLALDCGYKPTNLGTSRLRTETAGIAVCTIFNFINA